ncbi:MAG: tetratricopeptide repeat protein [Crocinitomicaceae bacterium]
MISRLIVFVSLLPLYSLSQSSYDSLQKIWTNVNLEDSIRFGAIEEQYASKGADLDNALRLTDYHLELAKEKKSLDERFLALRKRSSLHFYLGNFTEAKVSLKEARTIAKEIDDPYFLFKTYLLEGAIFVEERKFLDAIKSFNEGKTLCRKNNLERGEINTLVNLASVYMLIRNYDVSIQYSEEAEKRSNELGYKEQFGLYKLNMGTANHDKGNYTEAIFSFKQGLEFFIEENNTFHQSSCYHMLASCYHNMNNDEKALEYLTKSLKIDSVISNDLRTFEGLALLGEITLKKDPNEALRIGLDVLKKTDQGTPQDIQEKIFHLLYSSHKALGNHESALEMHELYKASSDSMRVEESNFSVIRETMNYEFEMELQEAEIANQQEQAELKIGQIRKNYLIISISAAIIALVIIFFMSKNIKVRKKKELLLKELNELKNSQQSESNLLVDAGSSALNRENIEASIGRKLNETDWKVLQILLDDPMITNKEIASKAYLSEDGIGSSLRRMYEYFEIKETKYKKIALLMDAIKRGREQSA